MTAKQLYIKLLNDGEFLLEVIVDNNLLDVIQNLEKANFTDIQTKSEALAILINLANNGRVDELAEIIDVDYIEGQSGVLDEAMQMLQDQHILNAAETETRVVSAAIITSIAGAVGNIAGTIFNNSSDKPTQSATIIAAQQAAMKAEADRKRKNTMLIVGGVIGLLILVVVVYKMFKS